MRFHAMMTGLGLALVAALPVQAKVIFTDSFESPSQQGGFSYGGTDAAGATFGNGTGLFANGSLFGYAAVPDGVQGAHIQDNTGSVTETVSGLTAGNVFTLSFYAAARPGYAFDPLTVSYTPFGDIDPVLLTIASNSTDWTKYSTSFIAQGDGLISFTGSNSNSTGDFNVGIDAVQISTGGVPEPGTWAMMLIGFGALGILAYRRTRSNHVVSAMAAA